MGGTKQGTFFDAARPVNKSFASRNNKTAKAPPSFQLRDQIVSTVLESSRESRWLSVTEIASRLGASSVDIQKAIGSKPLNDEYAVATKASKKSSPAVVELLSEAPIYALHDVERLAESDRLFQFAGRLVEAKRRAAGKPLPGTIKQFTKDGVDSKQLRAAFEKAVSTRLQQYRGAPYLHLIKPPKPPKPPKSPSAALLAERLAMIVRDRAANQIDYPVTQAMLQELGAQHAPADTVAKALKAKPFKSAVVCIGANKQVALSARYLLESDLPRYVGGFAAWAIEHLSDDARSPNATTIFSAADLAVALSAEKDVRKRLLTAIESAAERGSLPPVVGWLRIKGVRQFFNQSAVESSSGAAATAVRRPAEARPAAAVAGFPDAFNVAFHRLNESQGRSNFVRIDALRRELPQFGRDQFDAGLLELERADRYLLEPAQGGAVKLSDTERASGIVRNNSLLFYVKRA